MQDKLWTFQEMRELVGRKIRVRIDFSGVPKETTGKVMAPRRADYTRYGGMVRYLPIKWDKRYSGLTRFNRDEFERFLELAF